MDVENAQVEEPDLLTRIGDKRIRAYDAARMSGVLIAQ
jgi:hypothetical protein